MPVTIAANPDVAQPLTGYHNSPINTDYPRSNGLGCGRSCQRMCVVFRGATIEGEDVERRQHRIPRLTFPRGADALLGAVRQFGN